MSTANLIRTGGIGAIVAAGLFLTSTILLRIQPPSRTFETASSYLYFSVLVIAFVGAVLAILGLHLLQRNQPRYGFLGSIGAGVSAAGYAVVALHTLAGMLLGNSQAFLQVRMIAALAVMAGCALFGVMTLLARRVPWWCGVLLIVAFPLGDLSESIMPGGEGILLALLWATVGVALLMPPRRATSNSEAPAEPGHPQVGAPS
jgi:hypothetical protein